MSKMKKRISLLLAALLVASIFGGVSWGNISKASAEPTNVALASNGSVISTNVPNAWGKNNGYDVDKMINGSTTGSFGMTDASASNEYKETKVQIDFAQAYTLSSVQLYKVSDGGFPVDFTISVYTTNGWKTVVTAENYASVSGFNTFTFEEVDANKVRLIVSRNGKTNDNKYATYLHEFEVYGVPSDTVIQDTPAQINVAAAANGATIQSEHKGTWAENNGYGLANMINGVSTGSWGMTGTDVNYQNEPMNIDITFQKEYRINQVKLFAYKSAAQGGQGGFPTDFEIQVYSDDNWVTVTKKTDYVATEGWNTFEFSDISATAIRLATTENGQTSDGKYGIYLGEFEVYGYESQKQNIALASNGTVASTTHPDTWGENNGFSIATLNNGKTSGYYFITETNAEYQNTQMSVTLLFDKAYKVNETSLFAVAAGGFPEDFTIDVYTKNGWETVVTETGYTATEGEQNFVFGAVDARAIRLTTTKNGITDQGKYGIYLYEFEVYGKASSETIDEPSSGNEPTPPPSGEEPNPPGGDEDTRINVALSSNGTKISTTHPDRWGENNGFGIANMNDGKATSGNYGITAANDDSQNTQMSVTLNFNKAYKVNEVCLYAVAAGGFPEDFTIEAYTQNGWKTVVSKSGYTAEAGKQSFVFDAVDCLAIRLTSTKNGIEHQGKYGIYLQEFEVYGVNSDVVITPEETEKEDTPQGDGTPNIAAASNGTEISTSHPDAWGEKNGFGIANMIDGKGSAGNYGVTATSPSYQNTQISISVNFKQVYKVNKICLYAVSDGGFPEDFTIAAYTKSGWKTVLTKRGYKAESGCQTFEINPIDCSAIKLTSTKNGVEHQGKYGIYLREIEVYGVKSNVSIPKAPSLSIGTNAGSAAATTNTYNADKNLALNMPIIGSSDYGTLGFGIEKANDGNLGSLWSSYIPDADADKPEWVEINLLGNYKIDTIALYARSEGWGFPNDFTISVFYDDEWIEVVNKKGYTDSNRGGEHLFKFEPVVGNKVRVEGMNFNLADGEYCMQLGEVVVYGEAAVGDYILPNYNYVSAATVVNTYSTLEDFGFYTAYLTDGDVKTGYSSQQHNTPEHEEWIELDLKRNLNIGNVLLKPAIGGNGFPTDFEIQVMLNDKWETVRTVTGYEKPVDEAWQEFVLDEQYKTNKVRIYVNKLGDDFGQYSLRLNEIEIYPYKTEDKDTGAVQLGNKELAVYNTAEVVETKTVIPTNLIVTGGVVILTAVVGIAVVYVLTILKMKGKNKE